MMDNIEKQLIFNNLIKFGLLDENVKKFLHCLSENQPFNVNTKYNLNVTLIYLLD